LGGASWYGKNWIVDNMPSTKLVKYGKSGAFRPSLAGMLHFGNHNLGWNQTGFCRCAWFDYHRETQLSVYKRFNFLHPLIFYQNHPENN